MSELCKNRDGIHTKLFCNSFYKGSKKLNQLHESKEVDNLFLNLQNLTYLFHKDKTEYQKCSVIAHISGHGTCKLIENNNVKFNPCLISVTFGPNINEDDKIFIQYSTSCAQLRDNRGLLSPKEDVVNMCAIAINRVR